MTAAVLASLGGRTAAADDPVFSGPQPGEKLVPFSVAGVYDERAGKTFDPVAEASDKPLLLVFVHDLTRPGMALTRGLTRYARSLQEDDRSLDAAIIWLDDDKAEAERYLTRARKSLDFTVPVGISVDGGEGPGAYGLNRNVELTILVAKEGVVTANFALVQPSVSEAAEIAGRLAEVVGVEPPTAEQLQRVAYPNQGMMRRRAAMGGRGGGDLRTMMQRVIRVSDEEARKSAIEAIEKWVGKDEARRSQLARMSAAVIERGLASDEVKPQLEAWSKRDAEQARSESGQESDKRSEKSSQR